MWDLIVIVAGEKSLRTQPKNRRSLPPVRVRLRPGTESSDETPDLNPRFARMLMGWPEGWTDSLSPVTGFSQWLQRSRSYVFDLQSMEAVRRDI